MSNASYSKNRVSFLGGNVPIMAWFLLFVDVPCRMGYNNSVIEDNSSFDIKKRKGNGRVLPGLFLSIDIQRYVIYNKNAIKGW